MSTIIHNLSTEYINIGCNRVPQAAAWGIDGLVAFGAHNYVALYYPENPECEGIVETLEGHSDKVNCVDFINRGDEFNQKNIAIVSGSVDKTVRVWKKSTNKWVNSATLDSHVGSVNTLGLLRAKSILVDKDLIATGSADGTIKIWERMIINDTQDSVKFVQTINLKNKYPLSLALSYLPESKALILACGSTDKKISLFVQKSNQFTEILSLQGHENWIRSVAFTTYTEDNVESNLAFQKHYKLKDGDLLLASASQDKYVRLWKMSCIGIVGENNENDESNQSILKEMMTNLSENIMPDSKVQLSTKAHIIDVNIPGIGDLNTNTIKRYNIMFEALLTGHDNCVYSVNWHPPSIIKDLEGKFYYHQSMALLTASSDKSMMIWKPEIETGVWVNLVTVGEIGGYTLGFFGGLFSPNGNFILAHGHTGAFHLWKNLSNHQNDQDWLPQVSISGHFNSVQDISWNPTSQYLISVSLDQTSRLFAPWCRDIDNDKKIITWHEIGRPQIHGYDLKCIAFLNQWRFVSGADEKILRVFDAPKTFIKSLLKLSSINENLENISSTQPVGANLPALGLSNKAIFQSDIEKLSEIAESEEFLSRQNYLHSSATPNSLTQILNHPPYEEHLLQHTLWPEIDKLYGHGYEIVCVGVSHNGKYLASACKSTIAEHAVIRLYDTKTMKELSYPLQSSSLTVTRIKFSYDDEYLLTVSRDRSWNLFKRCDENPPYKYLTKNKAHGRIIWDCSWSHDDKLFATASRDKTVKFWIEDLIKDERGANDVNDNWNCVATIKLSEAVTAVDFSPIVVDNGYLISIGLENGKILFYHSSHQALKDWKMVFNVEKNECHVSSINRLMWSKSPIIIPSSSTNILNNILISNDPNKKSITKLQLASCGDDGCVRIFNIFV